MANFSMSHLERQKEVKVKETESMKEQASDIEVNITEVYDVLAALPGGLDKEITDQILAARNAAQAEAGQEGKDLENAQARTNQEFENLCAMMFGLNWEVSASMPSWPVYPVAAKQGVWNI